MTVEKEELKAAGIMEVAVLIQGAISNSKHRSVLAQGELVALESTGRWFDSYIAQLNADLTNGKINDNEIRIAKDHLTKVGEQLTQRAAEGTVEVRRLEGEIRGYQGLGVAIGKRLELAEAKIKKFKKESEETEQRRQESEGSDGSDK